MSARTSFVRGPRTLRTKLIVFLLPVVVAGIAGMTFIAIRSATSSATDSAHRELLANAERVASQFDGTSKANANIVTSFATELGVYRGDSRAEVSRMMKALVERFPQIGGLAQIWAPNAFDGNDAAYVGDKTQGDNGRFAPYWSHLDGPIAYSALRHLTTDPGWRAAVAADAPTVMEPYDGLGTLMTSYLSPIHRDGRFVGFVGIDVKLTQLVDAIKAVRVLDTGRAFAFSRSGAVLAAKDRGLAGKTTIAKLAAKTHQSKLEDIAASMRRGRGGVAEIRDVSTGKPATVAWAPVRTGGWSVMVSAPTSEVLAHAHALRRQLLIVGLLVVLLVAGVIVFVAGRLTRPLRSFVTRLESLTDADMTALQSGLEAMADGDLTQSVSATTEVGGDHTADEIGQAARSLDRLIVSTRASLQAYDTTRADLSQKIRRVNVNADQVLEASQQMAMTSAETGRAVEEITRAVTDVASGAEQQARAAAAAQEATGGVTERISQDAATAQQTAEDALRAREVARDGTSAVEQARTSVDEVARAMGVIHDAIQGLAGRSSQIGGMVDAIRSIAEQTNLLALNAAIEAARAGDQGRGFAVVADEVRSLAEESQEAAASIARLLTEIQAETERTSALVDQGSRRTTDSSQTVEQARAAFVTIADAVEQLAARIGAIAEGAAATSAATVDVLAEVDGIASVAERSAAASEQVTASAEETSASAIAVADAARDLAGSAEDLSKLAGAFRAG